jgi:proteasome lid subunit RPN8/RPN11
VIYTLTIRQEDYEHLRAIVLSESPREGAAYLLCGRSVTDSETRLLVREVVPVAAEDYLIREPLRLSIRSQSYAWIAKEAAETKSSILFVHSHPGGRGIYSSQDNAEEPKLMDFFARRLPACAHGSLLVALNPEITGRMWEAGSWRELSRIRILGSRFHLFDTRTDAVPLPEFFDRHVRAFGPEVQRLLKSLHVGVVGAGGTGSAVIEQLTRLGVGGLSIFDGEALESSNVTRVYGSTIADTGRCKAEIAAEHVGSIGLGTRVFPYPHHITESAVAKELRTCDLIFGCTDKERPRGILTRLALYYLIPVFDVGVKIDAPNNLIEGVHGRLTILTAGEACLFCRGRISAAMIALESKPSEEQASLAAEGYAPLLVTRDPAVVTFTTAVAAKAVTELLHRLTGFMGEEAPGEFRLFFHQDRIRGTAFQAPSVECFCSRRELWGRGDRRDFLDLAWAV